MINGRTRDHMVKELDLRPGSPSLLTGMRHVQGTRVQPQNGEPSRRIVGSLVTASDTA